MKRFAELFTALDRSTRGSDKLDALTRYFEEAPEADAAWTLCLLAGRKPKRIVAARELRDAVARRSGLPTWMVDECYDAVGDLGETLALLLPDPTVTEPPPLHELIERDTLPLRMMTAAERENRLVETWQRLDRTQRFLWHKIMLGNFRVGAARKTVEKALARVAGVAPAVMAHRMTGHVDPSPETLRALLDGESREEDLVRPYPFFLASPLESDPDALGDVAAWAAEWKYDGIRAQVIRRGDDVVIWSRGDELVTNAFPEVAADADALPGGTVLDGELLGWEQERPLPFALLQRRLNRKAVEPTLWTDVPVVFMAFDLLELDGADQRARPLAERRGGLEAMLAGLPSESSLRLAPRLDASSWPALRERYDGARASGAEGLMLKRLDSTYGVGRQRGAWWKWKVDPHTVDAVLVYAQRGSGRRAGLFTDFTFAVWSGDELVPITKAYSGLTDREFREVTRFVRRHTLGRHGPVHVVEPTMVFEIAFEAVASSERHRSGVALRFPRMARWRRDKPAAEADSLDAVRQLLPE